MTDIAKLAQTEKLRNALETREQAKRIVLDQGGPFDENTRNNAAFRFAEATREIDAICEEER